MMNSDDEVQSFDAESYPVCGVYRDEQLESEIYLSIEIAQLWLLHRGYTSEINAEQYRQRAVGNTLGKLLHYMKSILVAPGRNGKWSGWLKEQKISRATADRLVVRYAQAYQLLDESPQREPTEAEICKLFAAMWPRMEKTLTTEHSFYEFLRCVISRSGMANDLEAHSTLLHEPGCEPARASTEHVGDTTAGSLAGDGGVL